MLRGVTIWLREHAPLVTLWVFLLVPALGLFVNTIAPPERYGYIQEQALLAALALGALWLAQTTVNGAIFLYCSFALVPVGAMLEHYGGASPLVLTPLLGIVLVALLTRDERAIVAYGLVALVGSIILGALVDDLGMGGALAFFSGALTACALWWTQDCNLKAELRSVQSKQERVERGLRRITKELG